MYMFPKAIWGPNQRGMKHIYIYDIYVYTVDVCSFKKFQAPVLKHFLIYGNISDISHKLDLQQPGPTIAKKELYMQDEKIRIDWKYSWPSTNPPMDPKWTKQMHTYTYIYIIVYINIITRVTNQPVNSFHHQQLLYIYIYTLDRSGGSLLPLRRQSQRFVTIQISHYFF